MKTNVVKNTILSLAITTLASTISVTSVSAQSSTIQQGSEATTDVKYVGNNSDYFKFDINVKQQASQKLLLRILDENGMELYRETANAKDFNKTVLIIRNDYPRLQFVITGNGISFVKNFSISAEVTDNFLIRDF